MGFKKSELYQETLPFTITFPHGGVLNCEKRMKTMPYGQIKQLGAMARDTENKTSRIRQIDKELSNRSLSEVTRERLEKEKTELNASMADSVGPLVDYLVGTDLQMPALVKWDLTDDDDIVLPLNREQMESLDPETISIIAADTIQAGRVGEANGQPSQEALRSVETPETDTISPGTLN
jgi:hypothetical protein